MVRLQLVAKEITIMPLKKEKKKLVMGIVKVCCLFLFLDSRACWWRVLWRRPFGKNFQQQDSKTISAFWESLMIFVCSNTLYSPIAAITTRFRRDNPKLEMRVTPFLSRSTFEQFPFPLGKFDALYSWLILVNPQAAPYTKLILVVPTKLRRKYGHRRENDREEAFQFL